MSDSVPLLVFTGQVATPGIGKDAFQEADIVGITMPITKYNYQIRDTADIPRIIREAVHIATTGRPGPVVPPILYSAIIASASATRFPFVIVTGS